ncbi:alpha/beta fold hydrolase [Streptomyces sp. B21-105]|uniref:alpha/beta fold hydrolase n=1 Tax=Streptomyces sp. B21-105 TaxID=3039417 RepID=UPI002FEFDC6E
MTSSTTSATAATSRPLPNAEGAEHRWVDVRGIRLHVAEYGTGAAVLLLHGFPQHWFAWHRVAALSAAGPRLICPDLRGLGWSEQTRRGYDIDSLSEDMLALLDALGLDRVGLVGHDWGAHVGFRLCLRAPERFSGFLALNMAHPWTRQRAILPNLWRQNSPPGSVWTSRAFAARAWRARMRCSVSGSGGGEYTSDLPQLGGGQGGLGDGVGRLTPVWRTGRGQKDVRHSWA